MATVIANGIVGNRPGPPGKGEVTSVITRKLHVTMLACAVAAALSACATYKQTLTDAEGRTVTCEASGKAGILSGARLRSAFDECIADAKARGYTADTGRSAPASSTEPPAHPATRAAGASGTDADLQTKVRTLKSALAQGLISEAEYEAKLRALMESL